MNVIHILKDGRRLTDITGHVVRVEDASPLYQFLHSINRKKSTERNNDFKNGVRVCLKKS